MGDFSKVLGRSWVVTIHLKNFKKMGAYEHFDLNSDDDLDSIKNIKLTELADFLMKKWNESGKNRNCAVVIAESENENFHAHMALYGNTTTGKKVAELLGDCHVERQLGTKKELTDYFLKQGKHEEKGEVILCQKGIENIENPQKSLNDFEIIQELLNNGLTPEQILDTSIQLWKYEKLIRNLYSQRRKKEVPRIKELHAEWHFGETGTGKTFVYEKLCEEYGEDNVYLITDFKNGGFDFYSVQGSPPIIFLDDLKKDSLSFDTLLHILDKYSRKQIHARYQNTYALWTKVYITSIFAPEEIYRALVDRSNRATDSFQQLLRRLNIIVYHYIDKAGEYKTFTLPAEEYIDSKDMIQRAFGDENGFVAVDEEVKEEIKLPFD